MNGTRANRVTSSRKNYLPDTVDRIASGHPINRINELMPGKALKSSGPHGRRGLFITLNRSVS